MTGAHTPGPWSFEKDEDGHTIRMGDAIRSRRNHESHNIVEYRHGCSADDELEGDDATAHREQCAQATANARLIAAAPDLLEAALLQAGAEDRNANCEECDGEGVPELCPVCFPLFDEARIKRWAAIAKATGDA